MVIGLHGKRLKSPLVDWPRAGAMMVSMPALRMRDRDPAEYLGELAIMPRPQKKMPVVGHQAIGGDANLGLSVGLRENVLKRGVVRRLLEQSESADTPIQDMIGEIPSSEARGRCGMAGLVSKQALAGQETSITVKKRLPTPLISPRSRKDSRPL